MQKILNHSDSFKDNLLYGAEALLDQYIRQGQTHEAVVDQGKVTAAMYAYLYAQGARDMLVCAGDHITPVKLNDSLATQQHYTTHQDAKNCLDYVSRYLQQPDQQSIFHGLCEGLKKMQATPNRNPMERELAGHMGVPVFAIGLAANDMQMVDCAVRSIEGVSKRPTQVRLMHELKNTGLLEKFKEHAKRLRDDRPDSGGAMFSL